MTQSVGVFGLGAIGTAMAHTLLSKDSVELFYFNRSPKSRLRIKVGDTNYGSPIVVESEVTGNQPLDWLLICLKEHHFPQAEGWLRKLIAPNVDEVEDSMTRIAVIRNGLNLKEPLLGFCSEDRIVECIIDCPVQHDQKGGYVALHSPVITISSDTSADVFANLLQGTEATIKRTDDLKTDSWKKVCESASLGAILCLTGETCLIFKDKKMVDLYREFLKESILVAKADGAIIEDEFIERMTTKLLAYPPSKGSSMLTDRLAGRRIELGAKNGVIAEKGKAYGVNTPLNDMACRLLGHTNS